jgi:hypothetical protein
MSRRCGAAVESALRIREIPRGLSTSIPIKLVHDPALVELLDLVVLFHVERVHDGHDADELRLSGQEDLALWDDDRALNLELTEGRDLPPANTSSLKRNPVTLRSQL